MFGKKSTERLVIKTGRFENEKTVVLGGLPSRSLFQVLALMLRSTGFTRRSGLGTVVCAAKAKNKYKS